MKQKKSQLSHIIAPVKKETKLADVSEAYNKQYVLQIRIVAYCRNDKCQEKVKFVSGKDNVHVKYFFVCIQRKPFFVALCFFQMSKRMEEFFSQNSMVLTIFIIRNGLKIST